MSYRFATIFVFKYREREKESGGKGGREQKEGKKGKDSSYNCHILGIKMHFQFMQRPTSVFQTFSAFSLYKGHYQITRPIPSSPKLHDFSEAAPLLSHMVSPHCFFPICSEGSPPFHVLLRREDPKQRLEMPKVKSNLQDVCRLHTMTWKRLQQASRGADWLEINSIPSFLKMTPKERQPQGKREGESMGLHT